MFPQITTWTRSLRFSITYESLVLTTTGEEDVTIPVDQSVSLKSDSTATGVSVAENFVLPAREYAVIEVNYSVDQAITSDGQTAEIKYTPPASENVAELAGELTILEGARPYYYRHLLACCLIRGISLPRRSELSPTFRTNSKQSRLLGSASHS